MTEAAEVDRVARATARAAAAAREDGLRAELHGLREEAAAAAREPRELAAAVARAEHLETVVETLRSADSRVGRTEQELRHELAERQVAEASGQAALAAAAARLEAQQERWVEPRTSHTPRHSERSAAYSKRAVRA